MTLRLSSYRFWLRPSIYALPLLSFAVAGHVRLLVATAGPLPLDYDPRFYFSVIGFTSIIWALVAEHNHLCQVDDLFQEYTGIKKVFSTCITTYVILVCVLFFYRQQNLSRLFFGLSATILFILALLSRVLFRMLLRGGFGDWRRLRVLMVGTDTHACRIASRLRRIPFVKSEVVAYLRLPDQPVTVTGTPVVEFSDLEDGLSIPFDEVIIALPPAQLDRVSDIVCRLEPLCAPIRTILDFGDIPIVRERLFRLGELQMLDLSSTPVESPHYFLLKRVFDILFALLALIVAGPVMISIAILIKLTSRGPVIFRQERVGLNGKRFDMYKFRTMRVAQTAESDIHWTTQDDDRRTTIGVFLRKSSLDELPQFFNVLTGQMSVVGPRPERPYFVGKFLSEITHYNSRHRLKVGITGWAQVNGWRGNTSIAKRVEYDRYYLQNWSLWFDFRIILLTIWSGLFGKNAY